ncbi:MAG TPA: SRPBCC domain-containing protein [bacterium]
MDDAIHQEITLKGKPQQVYDALTDAKRFSQFTGGAPAEIKAEAGGAFSLFGGAIEGRTVELVPGQRLVQAWRVKAWDAGVYTIARFELKAHGGGTQVIFDQGGIPSGQRAHLDPGWHKMYWEPLQKYLG